MFRTSTLFVDCKKPQTKIFEETIKHILDKERHNKHSCTNQQILLIEQKTKKTNETFHHKLQFNRKLCLFVAPKTL